jgi:hypothetical protein
MALFSHAEKTGEMLMKKWEILSQLLTDFLILNGSTVEWMDGLLDGGMDRYTERHTRQTD